MNSSLTLSITTFVYGISAFLYLVALVFKRQAPGILATWAALLGLVGNTAGIIMRWVESYQMGFGHAPLSNLYESLVFFAWTITGLYLVIERRYGNRVIGAFVMPLASLAIAYASLSPNISDRIQPLLPALKSNWLIAHVIACFIGYAAFAIAFGLSIMYLIRQSELSSKSAIIDRFPKRARSRWPDTADDHVRVSFPFGRYHHGRCLGKLRLGTVLGLGSQRNMVTDYVVHICHAPACQIDAWLARATNRLPFGARFCCGAVHLFRCQPAARIAQLRCHGAMIFP